MPLSGFQLVGVSVSISVGGRVSVCVSIGAVVSDTVGIRISFNVGAGASIGDLSLIHI